MAGRPTLFAQRMKGESGFLGLLYPPAKKTRDGSGKGALLLQSVVVMVARAFQGL